MNYRYDCHCHVNEGSVDSKVKIEELIKGLIIKNFSGCLITDHNSYRGYEHYINNIKDKYPSFIVIKAIEYDTSDAGHFIVIMPSNFDTELLTKRGWKLEKLINYVHSNKGILGPAHPCSEPYLSIFSSPKYKNNYDICKGFDFIEVLNTGEKEEENICANYLAKKYNIPTFGGSDSHKVEAIGTGYTEFNELINTADDLINYINRKKETKVDGNYYVNNDRNMLDKFGIIPYLYIKMMNNYYYLKNGK